jgi:hypothetical protein
MDRHDIHPRRDIKLLFYNYTTALTGKDILVFMHIPKTGGTSVNSSIRGIPYVSLGHSILCNDFSDDNVPMGLIATRYKPRPNHYIFTVVRNPLYFFRSYFHHVKGFGSLFNVDHYDYESAHKGFAYFMESIMDRDNIWPSRKFLFSQIFNEAGELAVNWINRNERLDDDMQALAKEKNFVYQTGISKRKSPTMDIDKYFDGKLLQKVNDTYYREFMLFGYDGQNIKDDPVIYRNVLRKHVIYNKHTDEISMSEL